MVTMEHVLKWYPKNKRLHVIRVAKLTLHILKQQPYQDQDFTRYCFRLAICHDLFESNAAIPRQKIDDEELVAGIDILTHIKSLESYEDYCKKFTNKGNKIELAAYYVKISDILDHLEQLEKKKQKYINGLKEILNDNVLF